MAFKYRVTIQSTITRGIMADNLEEAEELAHQLFEDADVHDEIMYDLCNNAEVVEGSAVREQSIFSLGAT